LLVIVIIPFQGNFDSFKQTDVSIPLVLTASRNTQPRIVQEDPKPAPPPRSAKGSMQGLSGVLPSVPWAAPPAPSNVPGPAPAPAPARKSPFSWLSRGNTQKEASPPPVSPERRNTASSIATIGSNPEMMLGRLDEGNESESGYRRPARNSLKDRFKLLRMREEAGITSLGEDDKGGSALGKLFSTIQAFAARSLVWSCPRSEDATAPWISPSSESHFNISAFYNTDSLI